MSKQIVETRTGEIIKKYSQDNPPPVIKQKAGSKIIEHYKLAYDENHKIVRKLVDREDRYAYVQSFKDSTGVYNVLRILESKGGDISILDAKNGKGFYADISNVPEDPHSVHEMAEKSKTIVDEYNKILGTSYTAEGLLAALADGTIAKLIIDKQPAPAKEAAPGKEEE